MKNVTVDTRYDVPEVPRVLPTKHAQLRMAQEGIRPWQVELAVAYGERFFWRHAIHYWVGEKQVARWSVRGVDLSGVKNLHVVCNHTGGVITVGWRSFHPRKHRVGRPRRRRPW